MTSFISNRALRWLCLWLLLVALLLTALEVVRPGSDARLMPPVVALIGMFGALYLIQVDRGDWARWVATGVVVVGPAVGMLASGTIDAVQPVVVAGAPITA